MSWNQDKNNEKELKGKKVGRLEDEVRRCKICGQRGRGVRGAFSTELGLTQARAGNVHSRRMAGWHDKHGVLSGDLLKSVGHKFKRKISHLKRFSQPFKLARGLAGGVYFSVGILNEKIYITLPDTSPDGR